MTEIIFKLVKSYSTNAIIVHTNKSELIEHKVIAFFFHQQEIPIRGV
jgi:hypothetical protein